MLRAKTVLNGENNSTMNLDFLTTGRQIMAQKALIMTGLLLFFVHKTVFGTHHNQYIILNLKIVPILFVISFQKLCNFFSDEKSWIANKRCLMFRWTTRDIIPLWALQWLFTSHQLWVWAGCVVFITYSAACSSLQITDITKADGGGGGGVGEPPPARCIKLLMENKQQGFQGIFTACTKTEMPMIFSVLNTNILIKILSWCAAVFLSMSIDWKVRVKAPWLKQS